MDFERIIWILSEIVVNLLFFVKVFFILKVIARFWIKFLLGFCQRTPKVFIFGYVRCSLRTEKVRYKNGAARLKKTGILYIFP